MSSNQKLSEKLRRYPKTKGRIRKRKKRREKRKTREREERKYTHTHTNKMYFLTLVFFNPSYKNYNQLSQPQV